MGKVASPEGGRIDMVDALRGTALIGLYLVHMDEHFELLRYPADVPAWLEGLNKAVHHLTFGLFAGKAYAIFAMMFGISFTLILQSWAKREGDGAARLRFLWRLAVLGAMGYVHALLYIGDILSVLALLGLALVLLYRVPDRWLAPIVILLLAQVFSIWAAASLLLTPGAEAGNPSHWALYGRLFDLFAKDDWSAVFVTNLTDGQIARFWFLLESGRWQQMLGLLLLGMMVGRRRLYLDNPANRRLWGRIFRLALLGLILFYPLSLWSQNVGLQGRTRYEVTMLTGAWANLAQTLFWASGFALLHPRIAGAGFTRNLAAFGRMSLTCYLMQSLIWVPFFHGYGLGFYQHWGVAPSVGVGLLFLAVQIPLARWWLRHHAYGPAEWLWRCATLGRFDVPLRRQALV
ncbi:DUF418 domain-containing protein [Niveispirillum sp. KHB5.9]|uniref:DUF418 domain-containing protein n=1 Tax=Niveispirillum sp. KHB5.9 TaxID=3400269 RepID=UPI003A85802C